MAVYDPEVDGWNDISRREFVGWGFELIGAHRFVLMLGRNVDTGTERLLAYRP
jgi:hypothetical protein